MKQCYVSAKLYNMYGYGGGNKLQYYHTDPILQLFYSAVSTIKFISQQIRLVQVMNIMHTFSKLYTYYILTL
jgi:hypothetical protein